MLTASYAIERPADVDINHYRSPFSCTLPKHLLGGGVVVGRFRLDAVDYTLLAEPASSLLHANTTVISSATDSLLDKPVSVANLLLNNMGDLSAAQRASASLASINSDNSPVIAAKNNATTTAQSSMEFETPSSSTFPLRKVVSAPNLMSRFSSSVFETQERMIRPPRLSSFKSADGQNGFVHFTNKRPIADSENSSAAPSRTASPAPLGGVPTQQMVLTPSAVAARLRASSAAPSFMTAPNLAENEPPFNLSAAVSSTVGGGISSSMPPMVQQTPHIYQPPRPHSRGWFSFLNYPPASQPTLRHDEPSLSRDLDKISAAQMPRSCQSARNLQVIREDASLESEPQFAHQREDVADMHRLPGGGGGALLDGSLVVGGGDRSVSPTKLQRDMSARTVPNSSRPAGGVVGFFTHLTHRLGVTPSESNTFAPSDL